FHNNGNGTFTDVSKAAGVDDPNGYYGMSVIFSDFGNTGRPDIYVANDSTPKFLYKNLGHGKFQEIGLESGTAVSEDGSEQASMGIAVGSALQRTESVAAQSKRRNILRCQRTGRSGVAGSTHITRSCRRRSLQ